MFNKVLCIIFFKKIMNQFRFLPRRLWNAVRNTVDNHIKRLPVTVSSVTMGGGHFLSAYLSDPSNRSKLKPFFTSQKANNRLMPLGCSLNMKQYAMKPHTHNLQCTLLCLQHSGERMTCFKRTRYSRSRDRASLPSFCKQWCEENDPRVTSDPRKQWVRHDSV